MRYLLLTFVIISNIILYIIASNVFKIWVVISGIISMIIFLTENKDDINDIPYFNSILFIFISVCFGWLLLPYLFINNKVIGNE